MTRYKLSQVAALELDGFVVISRDTSGLVFVRRVAEDSKCVPGTGMSAQLCERQSFHKQHRLRTEYRSLPLQTHPYIQFLMLFPTAELQWVSTWSLMIAGGSVSFACIA